MPPACFIVFCCWPCFVKRGILRHFLYEKNDARAGGRSRRSGATLRQGGGWLRTGRLCRPSRLDCAVRQLTVACDSSRLSDRAGAPHSASRLACRSKSAASTGRRRLPAGPCWRLLPCGKSVSGRLGACRVALPPCLVPCDSSECCRLSPATVPPPAPARLPAGEGRECRQHPTTCRLTPKILYWYDILPINLPVNIVL